MAALTLLEASKIFAANGDYYRAGIIMTYARSTDLLRVMPFMPIKGNAYKYNQEESLPGVAFRGYNEGYTPRVGVINQLVETLVLCGGDLDVDKAIVRMHGEQHRTIHEQGLIKNLAHTFAKKVIKGDSDSDPKEFDGLQKRLTGTQLVAAGNTSGGDALSLAKLDELIDAVDDPTHLIMNQAMRRRLTTAQRTTTVGGYVTFDKDEFGRPITRYNDLPIVIVDENRNAQAALAFDEAAPNPSGATSTSIYCVSFGENALTGLQANDLEAVDLGEIDTKPTYRTRVDWYPGMAVHQKRCAARLWGINNVAVVA